MLWLLLALTAVVVVILWKGSAKKPSAKRSPPAVESEHPITVNASITNDEPPRPTPDPRLDAPLNKDAWEDWSDEIYAEASRELSAELTITYCDRKGQTTHRDITVEKYARTKEGGVLAAFCHLRQGRRPFYLSRIQSAADREDGAVIDDLGAWLDERYEASPKGARDRFIGSHEAALGALFFVAKADDAFRAREKAVMRAFCATQGLDDTSVQDLVVDLVSRWAVPSRVAYGKDLRSLLDRDEPYRRAVLKHAKDIVGTGNTVRENEARALERMHRELKLPNQLTP